MELGSGKTALVKDRKDILGQTSNLQRPPQKVHEELLFINQHYDRARHGPSRRTIGSHVQRHIHKRKRLNSCLRLKSKPEHGQQEENPSKRTPPDAGSFRGVDSSPSKSGSRIWTSSEEDFRQQNSVCHEPLLLQAKRLGPNDTSLLPIQLPRDRHGFRFDPFNSYPIEFRESIPAAIDYCQSVHSPRI